MKKNAIQTLIFLNGRPSGPKFDSTNVHKAINNLPKSNIVDIEHNAKRYAAIQLQATYGIKLQQPQTEDDRKNTQLIMRKVNELRKNKSIRLSGFIQKIDRRMNYEQLQEARQFLQMLDKKEVRELSFTLEVLQKVVKEKLQKQQELSQNHTVASAMSLIQELKKANKVNQI